MYQVQYCCTMQTLTLYLFVKHFDVLLVIRHSQYWFNNCTQALCYRKCTCHHLLQGQSLRQRIVVLLVEIPHYPVLVAKFGVFGLVVEVLPAFGHVCMVTWFAFGICASSNHIHF